MDQSHNEQTRRIAKNTLYLYVRMLFGMIVSLYTSRVILQTLGVEDYGIYNVVGGFVAMFSLISSSLSSSIWRFMTFETGTGNMSALKRIVATSLLIQLAISALVILASETIGLWFLNTRMTIPPVRLDAANWVFQASILAFVLSLILTPYNAILVAHEKMDMYAVLGLLEIFLRLGAVLFVAYAPFEFDRLVVYALFLVVNGIFMQIFYVTYCFRHFSESHTMPHFYKSTWKSMASFAGWTTIGCSASLLKEQGVNVMLNIFFGPVVNAARGIAVSVASLIGNFSGNFMTAVNPQITKSYAASDRSYCFSLVERGSRFGYYIMLFFAIPIFLEAPYILSLWLGVYPPEAVIFTRLVILTSLIDIISYTLIILQTATGRIRNYQIAVGGMMLMNFPLSYLCLKLGAPAWSVYIVGIGCGIACLILRLMFLKRMANLEIRSFIFNVLIRIVKVSLFSILIPVAVYSILAPGLISLFIIGALSVFSTMSAVLFLGCDAGERSFIIEKIKFFKKKLALS